MSAGVRSNFDRSSSCCCCSRSSAVRANFSLSARLSRRLFCCLKPNRRVCDGARECPRSWPTSSLSNNPVGVAAQSTDTNRCCRRAPHRNGPISQRTLTDVVIVVRRHEDGRRYRPVPSDLPLQFNAVDAWQAHVCKETRDTREHSGARNASADPQVTAWYPVDSSMMAIQS